jgi:hydrogenase nickel incorporation protein HypA/HybF
MHEVSIALNLIEIVSEQCIKNGYNKIDSINIRVGRASGIMTEALFFAFDAVKNESIAKNASLNIEEIPLSGCCNECNNDFTVDEDFILSCPVCRGSSFRITAGREMDIIDMDVS